MLEGRQRDQWTHTSEVLAMIANTVRNPKKRKKPYTGRDLYPFSPTDTDRAAKKAMDVRDVDIKQLLTRYGLRRQAGKQKDG